MDGPFSGAIYVSFRCFREGKKELKALLASEIVGVLSSVMFFFVQKLFCPPKLNGKRNLKNTQLKRRVALKWMAHFRGLYMLVLDVLGRVKKRAEGLVSFRNCWSSELSDVLFCSEVVLSPET